MKRYDIACGINQWHMWSLLRNICTENNFNWFRVFFFSSFFFSSHTLLPLSLASIFIPSSNNNDTSRDNIFPIWKPNKAIWNPQMAIQLYSAKQTQSRQKTRSVLYYRCSRHTRADKHIHTNAAIHHPRFTQNVYLKSCRIESSRSESATCHRLALKKNSILDKEQP